MLIDMTYTLSFIDSYSFKPPVTTTFCRPSPLDIKEHVEWEYDEWGSFKTSFHMHDLISYMCTSANVFALFLPPTNSNRLYGNGLRVCFHLASGWLF